MATPTPQLLLRIRDLVRDGDSRNRYRDEVYIRSAVNPTIREMEQRSFARSRTATFSTVAGQGEYPFLTTPGLQALGPIYAVERVSVGAQDRVLHWREKHDHAAPSVIGDIQYWALWNDGIAFSPTPATGGEVVRVSAYCSPIFPTPLGSGDELQMTADAEDVLVLGAAWRMALIDSEFVRSREFRHQYLERLDVLRQKMNPDRGDLPSVGDGSGLDEYLVGY